jgi:glyoxylase-like metal-dependent hydrolase (beta-lactamase superfamily II)
MSRFEQVSRRTFIANLGRAAVGIVVLGAAACAGGDDDDDAGATSAATSSPGRSPASTALGGWQRVNLGIVSAYILVRGREGYLVDTGVSGKASDIDAALSEAGSSWRELGHLILTHKHPDHIGSIATPGHTPGHVSVLDGSSRVLVTGDAIVGEKGGVGPPGEQFTEDMDVAMRSVAKIAELDFDIALFGHGDPVTSGAKAKVASLADA